MRRVSIGLAGASLMTGCLGLLGGGDGVPNPTDAGRDAPAQEAHEAREAAGRPPGAAVSVASANIASDWCAVTASGDVECWGENESGELGDGTTTASATPVKVRGLHEPATFVSIGIGTACALTRRGAVYCWGFGADGELGNGGTAAFSTTAVPVSGLGEDVTSISCGDGVACAIRGGAVSCWGLGGSGLLGTGKTTDALIPVTVPGLDAGVTSVSVGDYAACAVKDGAVLCWGGFEGNGELGNGTFDGSYLPKASELENGVASVSVGFGFACALTGAGGVMCWGDGTSGQLGNGTMEMSAVPSQVQGLESGVVAMSAGMGSVSAIRSDGTVVAWGFGGGGALGNGSLDYDGSPSPLQVAGYSVAVPVRVKPLSGRAVSIATGQAPCAATLAGKVECWGETAEEAVTPVTVSDITQVTSVSVGGSGAEQFACAVSRGAIFCWGGNDQGQLGTGSTANADTPVVSAAIHGGATAVSAGADGAFACGIEYGAAYCWGNNAYGQLGNGTNVSSMVPVRVRGIDNVASISAGGASACAVTTAGAEGGADGGAGGAVWCWGDNTFGQLGNAGGSSSLVPMPVAGLAAGVVAVSLGSLSACALRADGTVWCWGANEDGQVGDGTMTTQYTPTQVMGVSGATAVSAGWYFTCAVANGNVQCWGLGTAGQLGNGAFASSATPVTVAGISGGASAVAAGTGDACAVVDGDLMCWGVTPFGFDAVPGDANSEPQPVPGLAGVTSVAVSNTFGCAVALGTARCWGVNSAGQLGNAGAVDELVPTPIAGFP
jgi:alpha-tubulin suppressor-like RCC1 family protein